jgi:hypothetical protein
MKNIRNLRILSKNYQCNKYNFYIYLMNKKYLINDFDLVIPFSLRIKNLLRI